MTSKEEGVRQPGDAGGEQAAPRDVDDAAPGDQTTDEGLGDYRLLGAQGEVITKEQNNTSRQISYLSRLLSQRNSLGKSRKYRILGTEREQSVKEHFKQMVGDGGSHEASGAYDGQRGPNTDIYSAFASRDQSAGTLQPNSPAAFMEPKHRPMAGTVGGRGSTKYLIAHRRGGSFSMAYPQAPQQPVPYPAQHHLLGNAGAVPYLEEQMRAQMDQGPVATVGVIISPPPVAQPVLAQPSDPHAQTKSFQQLPAQAHDPAQQIHRLHERSMAALHHLSTAELQAQQPAQMSALAPEGPPGYALGASQDLAYKNNANYASQVDVMASGAASGGLTSGGKGATSLGLNSTRLVRVGHRNKGVGESDLETPMVTQAGQVKYAGDKSLQEIIDQDYTELRSLPSNALPGMGVLNRNETDGTQLHPLGHHDYLQPQHLDTFSRNPEDATMHGPQRTQSFFNLNQVGSQQLQPATAHQYQEQLESWTAKSSIVGDAKALAAQKTTPGTLHGALADLGNTGFSQGPFAVRDFAQPPYIVQHHQMPVSSAIASPYYGHYRMNLHSQSMLLQSKSHQTATAAMRVRLEKQEIDKLLRKVRERKRASLVPAPNIRLDGASRLFQSRRWSVHQPAPSQRRLAANEAFIVQNPIVVTGIRRKSTEHVVAPLAMPHHLLNQAVEPIDQTLYARDLQLSRTLEADASQKIKIQDRLVKQESGLPGLDPTSQRVISTESLAPDGIYQHLFSAHELPESAQRIIEVTADHASAEDGRSESLKFHFGAQDGETTKNAAGPAGNQKRRQWNINQGDVSSTAAGQSARVIEQTASGVALNTDLNQPSVLQLLSPQLESIVGGGSDLKLNQQMSKQSFVLDAQTSPKRKRMSLPRIKQVFVSPNLRVGGMSARQRSILQSQKQIATLNTTRAQTKLQSGRLRTGEHVPSFLQAPQYLQQLPEESFGEHFSPSKNLHNMQSLRSIQQASLPEPLSGAPSLDNKDTAYTQAPSLASLAHAPSQQSDNFFVAIEQLPHLPLKVKLQAKELIRHLERQIRLKQAAIEKQRKANEEAHRAHEHLFETKKKLKKAAKDIVIYQKKQEQEQERHRKEVIAQDPDLDQKRQLEREMAELERQIQENEVRIAEKQRQAIAMVGGVVEYEEGQPEEDFDTPGGSGEQLGGMDQDQVAENARGAVQQLEGDAHLQMQMQNYPAVAASAPPNQQDQEAPQQPAHDGQAPTQRQDQTGSVVTPPKLQHVQSAEPTPIRQEEILEAPDEEQAEEAPPFVGLDHSPVPQFEDSPLPRITTEEPSPTQLQQALIDRAADKLKARPQRTAEERQLQANYAQIETRIYKLYRDYTQNDLKREKKNTLVALRKVKMEGQAVQDELQALVERNQHLKKTIKRYKSLVENFESEHDNLRKFLVEKREETTARRKKEEFQHMKKKINSKRRLGEFDAGGTTSPRLELARVHNSIKGADFLSHRAQEAGPTPGRSGDSGTDGIEAAKGGTLPKTNLKVLQPVGALIGADLSMPSERPDGTTVSLGSISARGEQEKIKVQALEKLFHAFKQAQRSERPLDIALQVMDLVKASFGCTKITLFPVDFYTANLLSTNLSKEKRNYLRQVSYADENDNIQRQLMAVSRTPAELCDQLLFKSLKNLSSDVRLTGGGTRFAVMVRQSASGRAVKASSLETPVGPAQQKQTEIASPPEIANKHEPAFILQGEIPDLAQVEPPKKTSQRQTDGSQQPPLKLNYTTLMSIQLLCMSVQLQFERLRLTHSLRGKGSSEVDELIQMIGRIYKHQNLKALMAGLVTEIASFFNFKEISIMFHDEEKGQLYTITSGDQDDKELEMQEKRAKAASEEELAVLDAVEAMNDLTLPATQLIYFPISVGISSMVFKQQRAMYFNNFNRLTNIYFVEEIDNLKSLDKIDNLLIAHTTRDDSSSNGLIQLFNHPMPITETDRKKLEAISRFFGSCIQNIEDKTKKITATLALQLEPGDSNQWLATSMAAVKESEQHYIDLLAPIEKIDGTLARNEAENDEIIAGTIEIE